ncbi:MAG TPA: SRPBCC family protein [Sphingobium sp.]|nr:SRPBCC family protein [Sphingobium sp.]
MIKRLALIGAGVAMAAPAPSAVTSSSDIGFAVEESVEIAADAATVYRLLGEPGSWWSKDHSYSGNAANLSLELKAGGCFCELLPGVNGSAGSVEHARVLYAAPGKQLRLSGALGPLQAEAVTGTLTFQISPGARGTRVTLSYVVGGYVRAGAARIAPIVDKVLAEQLEGLRRAAEARGRSGK